MTSLLLYVRHSNYQLAIISVALRNMKGSRCGRFLHIVLIMQICTHAMHASTYKHMTYVPLCHFSVHSYGEHCFSYRSSVRPFITCWCNVKMNEHRMMPSSQLGGPLTLFFVDVRFINVFTRDHPNIGDETT